MRHKLNHDRGPIRPDILARIDVPYFTERPRLHPAFQVISAHPAPQFGGELVELRHAKSNAHVAVVANDDHLSAFGLSFTTISSRGNGIAHMLEHLALCGSDRHPVRDVLGHYPISGGTIYHNAFTCTDKTGFLGQAARRVDFRDLFGRHLDAVFFPLLRSQSFALEGVRWQFDDRQRAPVLGGVVHNEMIERYGIPDDEVERLLFENLFPGSPFGISHGGAPSLIARTGVDDVRAFHETFYRADALRAYLYGRYIADGLELLHEYLSTVPARSSSIELPGVPRWTEPRSVTTKSAAFGEGESGLAMAWLLRAPASAEDSVVDELVETVLVGGASAVLREALRDQSLALGIGMAQLRRELPARALYLSVDEPEWESRREIESAILSAIDQTARKGAPREMVLGALRSKLRSERELGMRAGRGLDLYDKIVERWHYGDAPHTVLDRAPAIQRLIDRIEAGEPVLQQAVRSLVAENPHRLTLFVAPGESASAPLEPPAIGEVQRLQAELAKFVAEVPLKSDAPPGDIEAHGGYPTEPDINEREIDGMRVFTFGTEMCGLTAVEIGFDVSGIAPASLDMVPLLAQVLLQVGSKSLDPVRFTQALDGTGADVECDVEVLALESGKTRTFVVLRLLALDTAVDETIRLLADAVRGARWGEKKLVRHFLEREESDLHRELVDDFPGFGLSILQAPFHPGLALEERLFGVERLEGVARLKAQGRENSTRLTAAAKALFVRDGMFVSVTAGSGSIGGALESIHREFGTLPVSGSPRHELRPDRVAEVVPGKVMQLGESVSSFVGRVPLEVPRALGLVIQELTLQDYLWPLRRDEGGAYDVDVDFDEVTGALLAFTRADPDPAASLDAFGKLGAFLVDAGKDQQKVRNAAHRTLDLMFAPQSPDHRAESYVRSILAGESPARRREIVDGVRGVTGAEVAAAGASLSESLDRLTWVIASGKGTAHDLARRLGCGVRRIRDR